MERKPNPFESDLSIQAIHLISFIDGGGDRIGEQEKADILQYLKNYNGADYKASTEMIIDLFFELINEKFLLLNCW